jgi:ribosomal protein S18 acetylase RimI-like enzyme
MIVIYIINVHNLYNKCFYFRGMNFFPNDAISKALAQDIPAITALLNSAYRGERSRQGWTTEADLIAGDVRTDEEDLGKVMSLPGSIFLVMRSASNDIEACVNLQQHGSKIYLGMFAVLPNLQGQGMGKKMLEAATNYALSVGCKSIYMSVIDARAELIAWYKRHGYLPTGEVKQFVEDNHIPTLILFPS